MTHKSPFNMIMCQRWWNQGNFVPEAFSLVMNQGETDTVPSYKEW